MITSKHSYIGNRKCVKYSGAHRGQSDPTVATQTHPVHRPVLPPGSAGHARSFRQAHLPHSGRPLPHCQNQTLHNRHTNTGARHARHPRTMEGQGRPHMDHRQTHAGIHHCCGSPRFYHPCLAGARTIHTYSRRLIRIPMIQNKEMYIDLQRSSICAKLNMFAKSD